MTPPELIPYVALGFSLVLVVAVFRATRHRRDTDTSDTETRQ